MRAVVYILKWSAVLFCVLFLAHEALAALGMPSNPWARLTALAVAFLIAELVVKREDG